MKKSIKHKKPASRPAARPSARPDIEGLIKNMTERLITLEAKIDKLASLTSFAGRRPDATPTQIGKKQENGFKERILHKAVCAACSKECEVPFRPSGDRPVYCKECFTKRKNGAVPFKEKSELRSAERVLVYERSFQKDQAAAEAKNAEKKTPITRRRR